MKIMRERTMGKWSVVLLIIWTFCCSAESMKAFVIAVSDGDTIKVLDEQQQQHKIRLYGIDAPELHQAFGQKAKEMLASLIFNRKVRIECRENDQYGRIIGTVYHSNRNINLAMVKAGLAWHYSYFAPKEPYLAKAEANARLQKIGLWADPAPQAPWDYRRTQKQTKKKNI